MVTRFQLSLLHHSGYTHGIQKKVKSILLSSCVQGDKKFYQADHTNICHQEEEISVSTVFIRKLVHERYVIFRISV